MNRSSQVETEGSILSRFAAAALLFVLALVALTAPQPADAARKGQKAPKATVEAEFEARGSVGEVYVRDATPGLELLLVGEDGRITRVGRADSAGSEIFYELKSGRKFTVRAREDGEVAGTRTFRVLKPDANPKPAFYERKELDLGLNYVTMRDGVELAMTVRLPLGKTMEDGPFPTVVEHSGYQTAAPGSLIDVAVYGQTDRLAPAASTMVGSLISPLIDYAVVSVQMRGSGCSGGGFDLFGLPTIYDGYDAIETVAAQDWVKGGKVGMVGISFSGITQLLAAGTQPPSLAAVTPFSVTDDVYDATGYPGGIFNTGFAYSWISERARDAEPSPEGGQSWSRILSDPTDPDYDPRCAANQDLRLQTRDFEALIERNKFRTPRLFEKRAPGWWMNRIEVPTFLVGAFQDEQTGGHFPNSLDKLRRNPNVWISLMNGVHGDSLGPSTLTRWIEFLDLFVANENPGLPFEGPVNPYLIAVNLYDATFGDALLPQPSSRFNGMSVAEARREFKKDPRVRLLMDNGAAKEGSPGALGAAWELGFDSWPIRRAKPTPFYLGPNGRLSRSKPGRDGSDSYLGDPEARPAETVTDGSEWATQPNYDWTPLADGKGLGFTSPALARDTVIAGNLSADLWVRSSARDTDLQVTVTEVRPDGKETLVQSGWLRASHRKLNRRASTALKPVPTHLKRDARPMPKGRFALVRVPVFPVAHAFRAGSKIRLNILAPGGDRQIWDFDTVENGTIRNSIAYGGKRPSRLVLPVLSGVTAKGTPLPEPTALRGQPSRDYAPAPNGG